MEDLPASFNEIKSDNVSIADINFAYDNVDVIKILKKRADLLKKGKSCEKIENKLITMIDKNYNKYQRPVVGFVLFET